MRYGFWLPIFGGWLRNVPDEGMPPTYAYARQVAQRAEQLGYSITLIAELYLNDIKGIAAPSLEAWTTASALAEATERLELMVAVRPTFHPPAIFAKQAAALDEVSGGRLSLNVVSSWWQDEARRFGVRFDAHDDRYARTSEWLDVLDGAWREPEFGYAGDYYTVEGTVLAPKPQARPGRPRPTIYAGGESEAARALIAGKCDAYVMHGDPVDVVAGRVADMRARRAALGLGPMTFGMAAYSIVRDTDAEAQAELARITDVREGSPGFNNYQDWVRNTVHQSSTSLADYSVSNRGLRPGLLGTPEHVAERVRAYEAAGVDFLLLQCSPQLEEMERFAEQVMPLVGAQPAGAQPAGAA